MLDDELRKNETAETTEETPSPAQTGLTEEEAPELSAGPAITEDAAGGNAEASFEENEIPASAEEEKQNPLPEEEPLPEIEPVMYAAAEESVRTEQQQREEIVTAEAAARKKKRAKGFKIAAAIFVACLLTGAVIYAVSNIRSLVQENRELKEAIEGQTSTEEAQPASRAAETPTESAAVSTEQDTEEETKTEAETTKQAETEARRPGDGDDQETSVAPIVIEGGEKGTLTDVSDIVEEAMPAVVAIVVNGTETINSYWGTYESPMSGAGSGIVIGDNGNELWIVTNYHVIENSDTITIHFLNQETNEAYVKGTDQENDLAVLGIRLENMKKETLESIRTMPLGDSDELRLGEGVIAIGNAMGWGQSVTTGVVSALNRSVTFSDGTEMYLLQVSAAINPGNSGGALLNAKGELVGINNAKYSDTDVEGVGFAIPISSIKDIMNQLSLMEPREPVAEEDYPYMGVSFKELNVSYRSAYGIPAGAYIFNVGEGSPADKAGLLAYDIITKINNNPVRSYEDLLEEIQYYPGGSTILVTIERLDRGRYKEIELELTLGFKKDYPE